MSCDVINLIYKVIALAYKSMERLELPHLFNWYDGGMLLVGRSTFKF